MEGSWGALLEETHGPLASWTLEVLLKHRPPITLFSAQLKPRTGPSLGGVCVFPGKPSSGASSCPGRGVGEVTAEAEFELAAS